MTDSSTQGTFQEARCFTVRMSALQAEHWMYLESRGMNRAEDEAKQIPADRMSSAPADFTAAGHET